MSTFLHLNDLANDIRNFIQNLGYAVQSVDGKIAIFPGGNTSSIDFFKDCHISIFETSPLFSNESDRTVFIVSLDNCSCLQNPPATNCHTVGRTNNRGANGLVVDIILSDNTNCRYRVIQEIFNAIIKALDILNYFKGNNWNCHQC